jgi:hypothetical protein
MRVWVEGFRARYRSAARLPSPALATTAHCLGASAQRPAHAALRATALGSSALASITGCPARDAPVSARQRPSRGFGVRRAPGPLAAGCGRTSSGRGPNLRTPLRPACRTASAANCSACFTVSNAACSTLKARTPAPERGQDGSPGSLGRKLSNGADRVERQLGAQERASRPVTARARGPKAPVHTGIG